MAFCEELLGPVGLSVFWLLVAEKPRLGAYPALILLFLMHGFLLGSSILSQLDSSGQKKRIVQSSEIYCLDGSPRLRRAEESTGDVVRMPSRSNIPKLGLVLI